MLDGAFTSPKIRRLAAILGVPWPHALGLAGLLWRFTAKHAPTGEIGRHDDEEIAAALEWPGEAADLVASLVRCRLLDQAERPARLLVHDWPDHAPRYVLATLARTGTDFSSLYSSASTAPATEATTDGTTVETVDPTTSTSSSTSSSSSSSSSTSTSSARIPAAAVEAIWSLWVPGRKTGKAVGLRKIRDSIKRLAKDGRSIEDAARFIAEATRRDAARYRREVETGKTELQYVPLASTYFSQERWNDNDAPPDIDTVRRDALADEINRTRSSMGRELDPPSSALAELGTE